MSEISKPQLAVYVAAAIAIVLIGARYLSERPQGTAQPSSQGERPAAVRLTHGSGGEMVVDIAGAVRRPGVYHLPADSRVDDALRRAGGVRRDADITTLNRAAKLSDGRQVVVPSRSVSGSAGSAADGPLSLNAASPEQLDGLDGIGPGLAEKIIAYRQQNGGFGSVDELDRVPGIGAKRLAALREQLTG